MFRGTFNVVNNEGCKNWTCDGGLEIPPRLLSAILNVPASTSKKQIHWLAERSDSQLDPSTEMCYKKMLLLLLQIFQNTCVQKQQRFLESL